MKHMPWQDFCALVSSIGVVGLGLGATIPLTALRLDQRGIGTDIIGIITATSAFGILAATPFVSRWVARHGPRGCMTGAITIGALSTGLMEATDNVLLWGVLRFVFGACMGVLFTIGEAWVNHLAPVNSRGRVVAMYTTAFTLFQHFNKISARIKKYCNRFIVVKNDRHISCRAAAAFFHGKCFCETIAGIISR